MYFANMQDYFERFRSQISGSTETFVGPFGEKKILYADWIASGRIYSPIEERMQEFIHPYCANTHTETSLTGTLMTRAYDHARSYIKECVGATEHDALIFAGSGMTGAVNKLQRIMGYRIPERVKEFVCKEEHSDGIKIQDKDKPVVFISHMEHHSNHTSWLETICDVEIIGATDEGLMDLGSLENLLQKYADRKVKIVSITSCSNVTGIETPYKEAAILAHQAGGLCFVDFACSGPYVHIDMHPEEEGAHLDAIFISPHKFLGGPGTPGLLIFDQALYTNKVPDNPGGGTVYFTSAWNEHKYFNNVEMREDGGTPPFLQGIKTALAFQLKHEMGIDNILKREHQLVEKAMVYLNNIDGVNVLAENVTERLGAISFYIEDMHFNLAVKLLNDHFGIQVRGGCACAGTYGHYLLNINQEESGKILGDIEMGLLDKRPGWVRLSLHPTMTDEDLNYMLDAIKHIVSNKLELAADYKYLSEKNIFVYKEAGQSNKENEIVDEMFKELTPQLSTV